jgi:sensor histidine kinase regulating citrate/malate metabolism
MDSIPEIKSYVKSLEAEIQPYELIFNTGNKTLDIILSEKAQESMEKGAQVHVHADGQGWDVVQDTDLATIFGNAFDNAIEGTENLGDAKSRLIEIRVGRINDMLIARFENPLCIT